MERMFVDPETGDMHPESYYHHENIDLATVIEAVVVEGQIGFVIVPENVPRMKVRHFAVFEVFREFVEGLAVAFLQAEDGPEKDSMRDVLALVSGSMLCNLNEMEREETGANLH